MSEYVTNDDGLKRLLGGIAESSVLSIIVFDSDLKLLAFNSAYAEFAGIKSAFKVYDNVGFDLQLLSTKDGTPVDIAQVRAEAREHGYSVFECYNNTPDVMHSRPMEVLFVYCKRDEREFYIACAREVERRKRAVVERKTMDMVNRTSPFAIELYNEQFHITEANDAALKLYGFDTEAELISNIKTTFNYVVDGHSAQFALNCAMVEALVFGDASIDEYVRTTTTGSPVYSYVSVRCVELENGTYALSVFSSNTNHGKLEELEFSTVRNRFQTLFENNPLGCNIWSANFQLIDCNNSTLKMMGLEGRKGEFLANFSSYHPEAQPDGQNSNEKAVEVLTYALENGFYEGGWLHTDVNGDPVPIWLRLVRASVPGNRFEIFAYMQDLREIESMRKVQDKLEVIAYTDALTGINNRSFFNTKAREIFASGAPFSMLIIDVDHFKQVNDEYGHLVGDLVLKNIANQIGEMLRGSDLFARYGGEEFVVIIQNISKKALYSLAWRICSACEAKAHNYKELKFNSTVSVGVAIRIEGDTALEDVIDRADKKLYEAKSAGRNNVK